jgi:hypothetical protein
LSYVLGSLASDRPGFATSSPPLLPPASPACHMPAGSNALRVISSLRVGERGISRCGDGLLAAENALFDARDTVLRMTDPGTVREAGYMTTAREALGRLAMAGVTPEFAEDAARALPPGVAASFARGTTARALAGRLGPHELFDGAVYSAASQRYEGVWLDLRALSSALSLPSAAVVLQALHLAAALAEVPPTTMVLLSTSATRRPSERAHFRMILDGTRWLLDGLRRLSPNPRPPEATNDERMREVLLARVRERATADSSGRLQMHLDELESAIASKTEPLGPLANPELAAIEQQLTGGDTTGIDERLDRQERVNGHTAGTRYLRARVALLRGDEPPRAVAQIFSQLVEENVRFHEAALQAARAWHAAGDSSRARYYARGIVEDASASDGARLLGLEILESTTTTMESQAPPPIVYQTAEIVPRQAMVLARVPLYPTLGDAPPPQGLPSFQTQPPPPAMSTVPERSPRVARVSRYNPELVESLPLPLGASESVLALNELPTTSIQARVAMTRLARDLARDYRLWYAKTLRCNVLAVEAMQQHLANRYKGAPIAEPAVAWELRRHGALLSEIIARALDGDWTDVAPSEPGYWAMLIPPATRSWPIGRVYRFVALGNTERDLVSYYIDLEARVREARER